MRYINDILYNVNDIIWVLINFSSCVFALAKIWRLKDSKKSLKIIKITALIIMCISIVAISSYSKNLTEVPNVVGLYYKDACFKITDKELRYPTQDIQDNAVVVEQSIKPGRVVTVNTVIDLMVDQNINMQEENDEEGDKNDAILQELRDKGVPFSTLQLLYIDKSIEVLDSSGELLYVCGDEIDDLNINEILLVNTDYNIQFTQYKVDYFTDIDGTLQKVVVFEDIPTGYYELTSSVEGYQILRTTNMRLSTDIMQGNINSEEQYWGRKIGLVNNDSSLLLPYYITVVDSNYRTLENVYCYYQYEDDIPAGRFATNSNGDIPLCFMAYEGEEIKIIARDVFKDGDEYICKVLFQDVNNHPVIVLYRDGKIKQIGVNELYGLY